MKINTRKLKNTVVNVARRIDWEKLAAAVGIYAIYKASNYFDPRDNSYSSYIFSTPTYGRTGTYDAAINAISSSGMTSYDKQNTILFVETNCPSEYYDAIINIAKSNMTSYSKSIAIMNIKPERKVDDGKN